MLFFQIYKESNFAQSQCILIALPKCLTKKIVKFVFFHLKGWQDNVGD